MKNIRIILSAIIIVLMGFGWVTQIGQIAKVDTKIQQLVDEAEGYKERGLYQKAIETYSAALEIKENEELRKELIATYECAYADGVISRNALLQAIEVACEIYPKNSYYWEKNISFCLEDGNYTKAYEYCSKSIRVGAKSEALNIMKDEVLYSFSTGRRMYTSVLYSPSGYTTVYDGYEWDILTSDGERYYEEEQDYLSPMGNSCLMLVTTTKDTRILNKDHVTQAIVEYDFDSVRAIFDDMLPINTGSEWIYYDYILDRIIDGKYEDASSFANEKAVVLSNGNWYFINKNGEKISEKNFTVVKLFGTGEYTYGGIMIASENGVYSIYNQDGEKRGEFSCANMDAYYGGFIAFEDSNHKWGFVNTDGEIVIEPQYECAKSFSNGLAAIKTDGVWGFINTEGKLVIEAEFLEAGYFSDKGVCFVSSNEGKYHMITLHFIGGWK